MFEKLISQLAEFGVDLKDDKLLSQAFIHRSYLNEHRDLKLESNERLEFLGDSVLSLIVSDHLYATFPDLPEGQLTNYRSSIVKTQSLAMVSKDLGLGQYLHMAKGEAESGGKENPSLLADTYEALLGLIYLQKGIQTATGFVHKSLLFHLDAIIASGKYRDYKSLFQELVQEKYRISPIYGVTNTTGPDHAKEFEVEVRVNDTVYAKGSGKSKQEAEQSAAKAALDAWSQS
jgi:ribonuclease III